MLTNLVRAGLARAANHPYEPMPTMYDGLFPNGTFLTRATRPKPSRDDADRARIVNGNAAGAQLEATSQTSADDVLVGKVGIITANVATGKAGEIRLPVRGGTQDYLACARDGFADTMDVDATAEVVAFVPPNTVYVKPVRV